MGHGVHLTVWNLMAPATQTSAGGSSAPELPSLPAFFYWEGHFLLQLWHWLQFVFHMWLDVDTLIYTEWQFIHPVWYGQRQNLAPSAVRLWFWYTGFCCVCVLVVLGNVYFSQGLYFRYRFLVVLYRSRNWLYFIFGAKLSRQLMKLGDPSETKIITRCEKLFHGAHAQNYMLAITGALLTDCELHFLVIVIVKYLAGYIFSLLYEHELYLRFTHTMWASKFYYSILSKLCVWHKDKRVSGCQNYN